MEIRKLNVYLQQYRLLEDEIKKLSLYVDIRKKNYSTFSYKILNIFLSTCTEIDSLTNEICIEMGIREKERYGILKKMSHIIERYSKIPDWKCDMKFPYEEIHLHPFSKAREIENINLEWWSLYNKVKHKRTESDEYGNFNYEKVNLKSLLDAFSAFFILLNKVKEEYCKDFPEEIQSDIFEIGFCE